MKYLLIFLLPFVSTPFLALHAQNSEIDSLQNLLVTHKEDTSKVLLFLELSFAYEDQHEEVLSNSQKALNLANKLSFQRGKAQSMIRIGRYYSSKANYDEAFVFYKKALKIAKKIDIKDEVSICYMGMGYIYDIQGRYIQALEYYQKNISICEIIGSTDGIITSLINIGNIHSIQGENDKGLQYYKRSLKLTREIDYKSATAICLVNIGDIYNIQGDYDKALQYILEGKEVISSYGGIEGYHLEALGSVYQNKKEYNKVLPLYDKALKKYQKLDDTYSICLLYISFAKFYLVKKDYTQVLIYTQKGLKIANKLKLLDEIKTSHELLAISYAATNNYQKAYENHLSFKSLNDSIFNEKNIKKLTGLEYQYKHEKEKQVIALKQAKKDAIQEAETKEQNKVLNLLIIGILLTVLLVLITVYGLIQKRKANTILAKQKLEIEHSNEELNQINEELNTTVETVNQQKEEILSTNEELNITLETVNQQKETIEESHQKTQASINYASRIQQALLPSQKLFSSCFSEYFILYKPKDIVSGDFYYFKKINEFLVIAVGDCTGHGVPGAFVSLLGISFLNEIVVKKEIKTAAQVLEDLRKQVKTSLKQTEQGNESKDGMDIGLCIIDIKTNLLQFAGAYNPLYLIRDKELIEIKGTKNPIGVHLKEKEFENHKIQLVHSDVIYLASDGYQDQFGGEKGMKFMTKNFKQLLLEVSQNPFNKQKEILESEFQIWKKGRNQIDDITILGFKL